jgi:serine/threonine protein kinase/WD40 repeat protein
MTARPNDCDRKRLRLSLDDRLNDAEQSDLAEHLEHCEDCRGSLEQMAAASGYWGEAALLRGEATTGGPFTVGGVGQGPHDHECEDDFDDLGAGLREFLEPPDPAHPETIGRMGPYEILEVLGRGGMGVVLKARDPGLDRIVAIKVLTPALAHGGNARRRFAREARAVAAVGHEHIVAVYAVDEFRGLPYLVMQYIPGRSLQERLDASGPLEVREILRIGTQAARALAAAHAQGVVHRDIKPANILLENCVERVKLTDFGLARAIDDASLTQSGVIAGTPQYMAPEQARGEPVDARADLFALGAAIYAMATGRSPFRADSAMAVLKRVCDAAHRPIREINPDVPAWLEAVIDRLLAKAPADRFQTATEVADLLEKGLAHIQQPTSVPPPRVSAGEANGVQHHDVELPGTVTRRRVRRPLALAAAVSLLAVLGLSATEAAGLTNVSDFVVTVYRIVTAEGTLIVQVNDSTAKVQIDRDLVIIGGAGDQEIRLRAGSHRVQTIKDGKPVRDQLVTITRGGKEIVNVDFEPTIQRVESDNVRPSGMSVVGERGSEQTVLLNRGITRKDLFTDQGVSAKFIPSEAQAQSADGNDKFNLGQPVSRQGLTQGPQQSSPAHPERTRAMVWSLAFSPDGQSLAIAQQAIDRPPSILRIWDVAKRRDLIWYQHTVGYRSVAFSSDGRSLTAGSFDGTLSSLEFSDRWKIHHSENQGSAINTVVFLPKSTTVAVGDWDGWVRFHGPDAKANAQPLKYPARIWSLAVSPDGSMLAVGGDANTVKVYDLKSKQHMVTLNGDNQAVKSLDFSPDGKLLAAAGGTKVTLWDTTTWADRVQIQHHPEVVCVRFSPDGKLLAIADGESDLPHYKILPTAIILWDVAARDEVRWLRGHTNTIWALAFSPDGKTLASGSADQTVKFWDTATGELRETIVPGEFVAGSGAGK